MAAVEADRVVVALIGDTSGLDAPVAQAAQAFDRNMTTIEGSAVRAEKAIKSVAKTGGFQLSDLSEKSRATGNAIEQSLVPATNAASFAAKNLGFQIGDIGTQLSGGQSPFLIISQQGPQVAQALQEIKASGAGLGQVLSTVALPGFLSIVGILAPFVSQLLAGAGASDTKRDAIKALTASINDLVKATDQAINSGAREIQISQGVANALLDRARATRELTKAQIQSQIATVSAAQATEANGGGAGAGLGIIGRGAASQESKLATLRKQLADTEQAEARARVAVNNANSRAIQQRVAERTDPRIAAEGRYNREVEKLNNLRLAGIVNDQAYKAQLTKITNTREREIKAIGDTARAERKRITDGRAAERKAAAEQRKEQREAQREFDQLRARLERLDKQLDPAGASAKEFAADLATIKDAMEAGIITPARAAELQLKQLETALRPIAAAIGGVGGSFGSIGQDAGKQAGKESAKAAEERDKEQARVQQERARNTISDLADLYESAFTGGTRNLWDEFKRQGLRALALLAAQKTFELITGQALPASGSGNNGGSGLGSIFASIFGRASGGYVAPGQTVRVNENRGGVELLRMGSQGGTVIPLGRTDAARPMTAPTIVSAPQFNLKGAVVTRELLAEMDRISRQNAAQASAAMGRQVLKAVPGRVSQFQTDEG